MALTMIRKGFSHFGVTGCSHSIVRLEEIAGSLKGNGGRVTDDLHDPKLTHIVCAGPERYESLVKATSEYVCFVPKSGMRLNGRIFPRPHRKQIVMIDWVFECQDEGTLVAEDGESAPIHSR
jgi:hypothetical protein